MQHFILNSILVPIAKFLAVPTVFILSVAGYNVPLNVPVATSTPQVVVSPSPTPSPTLTLGAFNPTGGGTYRMASSIGSTNTSINLSSFKEPVSNIPYTMAYLNSSVGYGTLDPQQPTRSEFVSFTGVTQNSDGTAVLTGVTRGLSRTTGVTGCVASSTLASPHAGQSIFILSNSPCFYAEYAIKKNDEVITGSWTVPTPVAGGNPTPRDWVLSLVNGGTVSTDRVTVAGNAGETFATGTIVYFSKADQEWMKAAATATSTSQYVLLGIAQGNGTNGVGINGGVLLKGIDLNQGTTLTAGQSLYISNTAGATSTTKGTYARVVGIIRDSDEFYFDPYFVTPGGDLDGSFKANSLTAGPITSSSTLTVIATSTFATTTSTKTIHSDTSLIMQGENQVFWGLIASSTVGSGSRTATISNIPPRSLLKIYLAEKTTGTSMKMYFNGDTGINYSFSYGTTTSGVVGAYGQTAITVRPQNDRGYATINIANGLNKVKVIDMFVTQTPPSVFATTTIPGGFTGSAIWATSTSQWINSVTFDAGAGQTITAASIYIYGSGATTTNSILD